MRAVVYKGNKTILLEDRPQPVIQKATDAVIKVTLTTICSSDIHIKHGAVPKAVSNTVLGHEFIGEVVETGSGVLTVKPGDRVAVNVETFCGECFFCERGFVNNCTNKLGGWALGCRMDGGQAEYARIPFADNGLTKIPRTVSDEAALFTGDILATGYWAAKLGELKPGDTVAVIGAGPVGLCTMMSARLYGLEKIIAVDVDYDRLKLAQENGLADVAVNPLEMTAEELEEAIKAESHGRGADAVFEAAGGRDTFQTAWRIARPNAIVVLVAMYEEGQLLPLPDMYGKNLIFKTGGVDGSCCKEIMTLIEAGKLDTSCLITHRTDLTHILEAYDMFEQKRDGVVKYAVRA